MSKSKESASDDQGTVCRRMKPVFEHLRASVYPALVLVQERYVALWNDRSEIIRSELDLDNSSERIMRFPANLQTMR